MFDFSLWLFVRQFLVFLFVFVAFLFFVWVRYVSIYRSTLFIFSQIFNMSDRGLSPAFYFPTYFSRLWKNPFYRDVPVV